MSKQLLASFLLVAFSLPIFDLRQGELQAHAQEAGPLRPAPDVIAAWEKSGAEFGWIYEDESGALIWRSKTEYLPGAMPSFRIWQPPRGRSKPLPGPGVPFGVYFKGSLVTDAALDQIAELEQLHTLTVSETTVTDRGLKALAGLVHLQILNLSNTAVSNEGLKHLAGLKELRKLGLTRTRVTDAGLKHLAGLTRLQVLNLLETKVSGAGLKHLTGLTQLRSLNLGETKVTDVGLNGLAALVQLEKLNLGLTPVSDAGLRELTGLRRLKSLTLCLTRVTDEGLKELAKLKQLERLDVRATKVSGAWRKELAGLRHLKEVHAGEKKYTFHRYYAAPHEAEPDKATLERQLQQLLKARVESARLVLEATRANFEAGTVPLDDLAAPAKRLAEAELAVATNPEEQVAALNKYLTVARQVEKKIRMLYEIGTAGGEATKYHEAKREREMPRSC